MSLDSLPIDRFLESILNHLRVKKNLILCASPGAGKTTRLPPALLELVKSSKQKILVLEPRRLAAVGAAARIADEQNWELGNQVGYQIRFDSHFQKQTSLIFLTEALLNRKLLQDPELSDVDIVVLDEFHERSQHVDLALGLLKELQQLSRPDLKIIVMSATLKAEPIAEFLGDSEIINVPGQSYPLEKFHQKSSQKLRTGPDFVSEVAAQIKNSSGHLRTGEHLLAFLPGIGEIERVFNALEGWADERKIQILKLHGSLSLEEQRQVLKSTANSKIILSTNVAESSVTIDGVRIVVDSGLQRRSSINPKTGFQQLDLARISKSSAIQRAGRAARQAAGKCYQMWSTLDEQSMPQEEVAEMLRTDLSEALLFLSAQSVRDFSKFSWFQSPSSESLTKAERHLKILGALTADHQLTSLGKAILAYPLPPRLGKLLITAIQMGIGKTGADLCALLLERDILQNRKAESILECDLLSRLEVFYQGRFPLVSRVSDQLLKGNYSKSYDADQARKLLLITFSDQICRRRKPGENRAVMIGGRGVVLDKETQVRESEFFIALQLIEGLSASETRVSLACGVRKEIFQQLPNMKIEMESWIEFDDKEEKFLKKEAPSLILPMIGALPLSELRSQPAKAHEIQDKLGEIAFQRRAEIMIKNEALKSWLQRFEVWQKISGAADFSVSVLQEIFSQASFGENSLSALCQKDLIFFFESQMDLKLVAQFKAECPETLLVPSGSKIRLDYSGAAPSLQVRLQEVFGLFETPKIANGKLALTLVLLAPNYRPVQVTQDLQSFWKNAYPEVRSELRARYPKHSWPDDPLSAPAQAKGRPRNQ